MSEPHPFDLERSVIIRARRSTVFRYFTDSGRFAAWFGPESRVDPRPGGQVAIRYPGGVVAGGEFLEIEPDHRIVFSYGYESPDKPIRLGGSRVNIRLSDHAQGTLLRLVHQVPTAAVARDHAPGWRFQLSLLANVATRELHSDLAAALVDRYFSAWQERDEEVRRAALVPITTDDVSFRDPFAAIEGREDLLLHITASQIHMPGMHLVREGQPMSCQGTVVVRWLVKGADGAARARGTNVFALDLDGKIASVVGVWESPA